MNIEMTSSEKIMWKDWESTKIKKVVRLSKLIDGEKDITLTCCLECPLYNDSAECCKILSKNKYVKPKYPESGYHSAGASCRVDIRCPLPNKEKKNDKRRTVKSN